MLLFLDSVLDTVLLTGTTITEFSQPCYNAIMKTMCGAHQTPPRLNWVKFLIHKPLIRNASSPAITQYFNN